MKNYIMRVFLAASDAVYDAFTNEIWIDLSSSGNLEVTAADKADMLIMAIRALLWETINYCATPIIQDLSVTVEFGSMEYKGYYTTKLLPSDNSFNRWAPELSKTITEATEQTRDDLKKLLVDMANGRIKIEEGGDRRYEISPRRHTRLS